MSRTEPEMVTIPKRDLVELFGAAIELQQATDAASRIRIDAMAARIKIESILRRVAPGLVDEVIMAKEDTPVEIPNPTRG